MTGRSFQISLRSVTWSPAEVTVVRDITLDIHEGSRLAIVGPNGIGKSSLLRIIAGQTLPTSGTLSVSPPGTSIGFVHQELDRSSSPTVRELLATRTGVADAVSEFEASTEALASGDPDAADRFDAALNHWTAIGAADFDVRLGEVAAELGLSQALLDVSPTVLSGGEAARVGLAVVLLSRFDLTLLDEPTNDLDLDGLERLERWVASHRGGLVFVSHDRVFLERAATEVFEIDEHARTGRRFGGGWLAYLDEQAVARAHAEQEYRAYTDKRSHLAAQAQQKREWVMKGVSRVKKNPDSDKHKNAFDKAQTDKLASKANAAERAMERLATVDKPWEGWDLQFSIATVERSGSLVAALDDAVIARGDFALGPITVDIQWADRVLIVGPNGSGKSTLIGAMFGRIPLRSGTAKVGSNVVVGELGQARDEFDAGDTTLLDVVTSDGVLSISDARSVLAKFGLDASAVTRPASTLSAGERTRAQLAMFQARGINCLILDEPTNHLDMAAIEQLEQALDSYNGTLIMVSHDRRFIDRVATDRVIDLGAVSPR